MKKEASMVLRLVPMGSLIFSMSDMMASRDKPGAHIRALRTMVIAELNERGRDKGHDGPTCDMYIPPPTMKQIAEAQSEFLRLVNVCEAIDRGRQLCTFPGCFCKAPE